MLKLYKMHIILNISICQVCVLSICFTPNFKIHFLISESISIFLLLPMYFLASGKEPTCQCKICRRCGFDRWVGKIP